MEKLEKVYLPLNTKRNKQNNSLLTNIKNSSLDLLEWLKKAFPSFVTVNNGLTNTAYDGNSTKIQLGGALVQDTTITRDLGNGLTYTDTNIISDIGGIDYRVDSKYIEDGDGRKAEITLTEYANTGDELFAAEMIYNDPVNDCGSGINVSTLPNYGGSKFIISTNVNTNVNNGVAYGVESWSDREEVNFFITDNAAAHDIGRIDLHASADLTTEAWILQYIVDLDTYSGNPNHGESSIYIGQDSFELRVKNQQGTYVYPDQSLRSNLIITDELSFNKPAIGDVFTITKLGYVKPTIPSYANDAAADADANLPSGGIYKLNAGRALYVKP